MQKVLSQIKEPGSAITHFLGIIFVLSFTTPMLLRVLSHSGYSHFTPILIFLISMLTLYTASTVYHTFDISESTNKKLRKFDHMAIYVLIAGTYTPICAIALRDSSGSLLLKIIWTMAIIGILVTAFWVNGPKWISSLIYIGMGWTCIFAFVPLRTALTPNAFALLFTGGVIYTIGGIIYALKLPIFNLKYPNFGSHEIFHLFVMGGSFCHFLLIYKYISVMPI